jgi:hypothetical protein
MANRVAPEYVCAECGAQIDRYGQATRTVRGYEGEFYHRAPYEVSSGGRPRLYCSSACRQRAYRNRCKQGKPD